MREHSLLALDSMKFQSSILKTIYNSTWYIMNTAITSDNRGGFESSVLKKVCVFWNVCLDHGKIK